MGYILTIGVVLLLPNAVAFVPSSLARSGGAPWRSLGSHPIMDDIITDSLQTAQDIITDDTLAMEAFEWCSNLGAPSALVAGAVLATLSQTREDLSPCRTDPQWVRIAKKLCRALLLSRFAMEIVCIFVTTVTGTMLLSHRDSPTGAQHAG